MSAGLPDVAPEPTACARCGCSWAKHHRPDGTPHQGWQASRFTGAGYCTGHKLSGGIAGMLQTCGCQGYQPRPAVAS